MIFDRQGLRAIQSDFERDMAATAKRHGVSLKVKAARFTNINAVLKFEICSTGPNGEIHSPEREAFKMRAREYGFHPSDLDGLFTVGETEYRITGLKTRRPKYPICAQRVHDGKAFKFPQEAIGFVSQG